MEPDQKELTLAPIAIALTFCSGAMDVASFTRLGNVFASVMTGNMVLCGLAIARGSVSLLLHTVVTFFGYVAGVVLGTRLANVGTTRLAELALLAELTLLAELALLVGLAVGWEVCGGRPIGLAQFCLLACGSAAMGAQSSAVQQMGLTSVSTTFLTGTLTGLVSSLAQPRPDQPRSDQPRSDQPRPVRSREGVLRPGVLLGLLAGALLCGILVAFADMAVPVLFVGALLVVLVLHGGRKGREPRANAKQVT
jgi:uncharacterized membrane protein YoaK (UPF0700 family)